MVAVHHRLVRDVLGPVKCTSLVLQGSQPRLPLLTVSPVRGNFGTSIC